MGRLQAAVTVIRVRNAALLLLLAFVPLAAAASPAHARSCPLPAVPADESPQVAPDRSFILFARREGRCPLRRSIWLSDLAGHLLRRLAKPAFGVGASWRADGVISLSRQTGTTLVRPDGHVVGHIPVGFPFWAPDSQHAAYQTSRSDQIYLWPGGAAVPGRSNYIASPRPWAPSGDRLAYIHVGTPSSQVVVAHPDGTAATTLYTAPVVDGPTWSPDGAEVAFSAGSPQRLHLYVSRADSDDDLRQLTPAFERIGHPAWSSRGRWIAFAARRDGQNAIYAIHPDGTGLHKLGSRLPRPDQDVSWSSEDTGVAYSGHTRACRRVGIIVARTDGHASRRLTNRCH
jgi:WD40 repeat protein